MLEGPVSPTGPFDPNEFQRRKQMKQKKPINRVVKFQVEQDEHDLIHIASALKRTSMANFARQLVLEEARKTVPKKSPTVVSE